jgi:hypothetical protein
MNHEGILSRFAMKLPRQALSGQGQEGIHKRSLGRTNIGMDVEQGTPSATQGQLGNFDTIL